jgi:hypothetical protein
MKWKKYPLTDGDPRAKKHFFESFSLGASNHGLSRRLAHRFGSATGPMFAIAMESLDLEKVADYQWAGTYSGGKQWHEARGNTAVVVGERSIDGISQFLANYLRSSPNAIVLCENWLLSRSDLESWTTRESRVLLHGDELYHIATTHDADNPESIEATVREADRQWLTGICSTCDDVPQSEITSEAFFDEIVAKLDHIFVSAFDGEGYLVWSPVIPKPANT